MNVCPYASIIKCIIISPQVHDTSVSLDTEGFLGNKSLLPSVVHYYIQFEKELKWNEPYAVQIKNSKPELFPTSAPLCSSEKSENGGRVLLKFHMYPCQNYFIICYTQNHHITILKEARNQNKNMKKLFLVICNLVLILFSVVITFLGISLLVFYRLNPKICCSFENFSAECRTANVK